MRITFREFLEGVERNKENDLLMTIDNATGVSDSSRISTYQPSKLRSSADKSKTLGHRVFYAYQYRSSEEITDLLKSIKGKGTAKLDRAMLDLFVDKTAKYIASNLPKKIDVVICPNSSSPLARLFSYKLGKYLNVEVIYDAFDKLQIVLPEKRADAIEYVIANFIDLAKFNAQFNSKTSEVKQLALKRLATDIMNSIKRSGKVELKTVYKPTAKFASSFMRQEVHTKHRLLGKNVLVADDSFSSGGTMMEIFRQATEQMGANDISVAVIFMHKSK